MTLFDFLSDLQSQVTASWLSIGSYSVMGLVLVETLGEAWSAGRVLRASQSFVKAIGHHTRHETSNLAGHAQAQPAPQIGSSTLTTLLNRTDQFLGDEVRGARYRLHHWELVAPAVGLGFTMLAFVTALPGALEALKTDPDVLFSKVGAGGGTSVVGVVCFVIALTQRLRLELAAEQLSEVVEAGGRYS